MLGDQCGGGWFFFKGFEDIVGDCKVGDDGQQYCECFVVDEYCEGGVVELMDLFVVQFEQ